MKGLLPAAFWILSTTFVFADSPVPATVEFSFDASKPHGVKMTSTGDTAYLKAIQHSGGNIKNGWWNVQPAANFGQGMLQFEVDRSQIKGDLALVLRADWQKDTNIAVQLLDAQGRAVALDLFGETRRNAQAVGTDTFVVPLERYPDATTIVIRRLSGDLRIVGGGLYPVLSEISSTAENEKALAAQLGLIISPHHWEFAGGGSGDGKAQPDSGVGQVHALLSIDKTNQVGAAALAQSGYPVYKPLTNGNLVPPKMQSSNSSEEIINNALRVIALRAGDRAPKKVGGPDSPGVAHMLLKQQYDVGFMSIALTSAEKEEFFRSHGHPILEFQFSRDAIMVLVNARSGLQSITIPQLDAIYGTELRAGAPSAITDWSELGQGAGKITILGGDPSYGTSRVFQQLVLKGGKFRGDMIGTEVVYAHGVESTVAGNKHAIGFATTRNRAATVRALAVAANTGEKAYFPNAEGVYSGKYPLQRMFYGYVAAPSLEQSGPFTREFVNLLLSDVGQTLVARAGSLPLSSEDVTKQRAALGLPE